MSTIDDLFIKLGNKMTEKLNNYASDFEKRTIEPSPGDVFDIFYFPEKAERFYYVADDYIIPLHRVIRGELEEFEGYRNGTHDVITWADILDSVDESDNNDKVYLQLVSSPTQDKSPATQAVNKLNSWAAKYPEFLQKLKDNNGW